MSTYKVIQDIEAEDKLVGPLSLRQFLYAGVSGICLYLSFLAVTKHVGFLVVLFLPVALVSGFFAYPWGKDQPTEIWALAKIRFHLKPRKRIWNQTGTKDLVTITVPKVIERMLTNGLDQGEVNSRLRALADTIDSRGWAVKNVNVNLFAENAMANLDASDRLVGVSSLPQEVSNIDVRASDDILDEAANPVAHHFDDMIQASSQAHRQQLLTQMQQPEAAQTSSQATQSQTPPNDYWFMAQQPVLETGQAAFVDPPVVSPGVPTNAAAMPQAATPTADELAMVEKFRAENSNQTGAYAHMKTLQPLGRPYGIPPSVTPQPQTNRSATSSAPKETVTAAEQAAIINLAQNDDLDVATIARQARKQADENSDDEVVISLR